MLWWGGLSLAVPGFLLANNLVVTSAAILLPLGFVLNDLSRARAGGITAMTAYSTAAAATSFANAAALLAANTPARAKYFLYVSEPHVHVAMLLAFAAAVVPPAAFQVFSASRTAVLMQDLLPRVRGEISDRQLVRGGVVIGLLTVVLHSWTSVSALGALSSVLFLTPMFAVFVLARAGTERNVRGALPGALVVASAEAMRAFLFGYLRGDVALPFVAFVLGALMGARSLRPLKSRIFLPVYVAMILFVSYFAAYGAIRSSTSRGLGRLQAVQAYAQQSGAMPDYQDQTVLSRLTTINQLSQVGRLVQDAGYLHGKTLDYLSYALIPRFLWPDKPSIAKGAWFAFQIGLANIGPSGQIMNSINMTIPGELYLNYGWSGTIVGLIFLGALIAALWRTTDFWSKPRNVLGTAFAFYLTWPWIGFSLGADLQILVTLIAVYLVLLAIGWILPALQRLPGRQHRAPSAVPS
jgi:hypothetical protein